MTKKPRFRKIFLVLLLAGLALGFWLRDQPPGRGRKVPGSDSRDTEDGARSQKNVFPSGENIKFGVYSRFLKVGSGELAYEGQTGEGEQALQHVRLRVDSFSVKDAEDVYGSMDFLFPVKAERKIRLFGRDEEITETYASDHKSVTIRKTTPGEEEKEWSIESPEPLQNVLLMVYRLRNDAELAVGKEYPIVLPTQKFLLKVKEITSLKVPLGTFEAFYIESTPSKYKIWISADDKRIPLRIQGLISFGSVHMAATEIR
ncbi:MAG: DUF3108 domain-containing protein [Candidatus Omnitrophota bacterium]